MTAAYRPRKGLPSRRALSRDLRGGLHCSRQAVSFIRFDGSYADKGNPEARRSLE